MRFRRLMQVLGSLLVLYQCSTLAHAAENCREFACRLTNALENRDFAGLVALIDVECRSYSRINLKSTTLTVDDRLAKAIEERDCVQTASAMAVATSSFEVRPAINDLLEPLLEQRNVNVRNETGQKDFLGLKWGVGVGISYAFDETIDEAVIVDGIVRATSVRQSEPRVFLEAHKYFWCNGGRVNSTEGCGPFATVAADSNNILAGVGFGFMYGRKVKGTDSDGFSVGIGAILDANVKDLGDGFVVNQPPPGNETDVRYKTESQWSAILFVTRTF